MSVKYRSIIIGSGKYIPRMLIKNEDFSKHEFYNAVGERLPKTNEEIIRKFSEITEIEERRYADDQYMTSDIGCFAAKEAIISAKIDKESLDYIIVAHNFGDIRKDTKDVDIVPSLASRIKAKLGIENPDCVAYDLPFGCPGTLQGMIQADYYIRSGDAKRVLIIGTEILSRIYDPHDIDCMIYSDGAGAFILESMKTRKDVGIISHKTRSDAVHYAHLLRMGASYNKAYKENDLFLKMNGRKLYEYALNHVPGLVKECMDKAGVKIQQISKVLIHQANAKMDEAILSRLLKLYNIKAIPEKIMPMTIAKLGNNSVATIPILYDLIDKGEMDDHRFNKGDYLVFASVGAGMNVNAIVYRIP
jgi:3-oxoacyl-[acyl-carrier-protein] synthase III